MRTLYLVLSVTVFCIIFGSYSCTKPPDDPVPPVVVPVDTSTLSVDGRWECELDGIKYEGTIDTSMVRLSFIVPRVDTIFQITGTSLDKRANINFRIKLNRKIVPGKTVATTDFYSHFIFDTTSQNFFQAHANTLPASIVYTMDTITGSKGQVLFSGTVVDNALAVHKVTNGKFSFELNKGNNEPKSYSFLIDSTQYAGPFFSARILANTLVMEGISYKDDSYYKFRFLIRTGGTLKPGVYQSKKGDVGLIWSYSYTYYYVDDTLGDLTVVIESVDGNIVRGSFSGLNSDGRKISQGRFGCRVKNYIPEVDLPTKWGFSEAQPFYHIYNIYGGNVTEAAKSQSGGRYLLTINGESDFGRSQFKIVISSLSPISEGLYHTYADYIPDKKLDSLYFRSPTPSWYGGKTYLAITDYLYYSGGNPITYCRIDTLNSDRVSGTFYGTLWRYVDEHSGETTIIKQASFTAPLK